MGGPGREILCIRMTANGCRGCQYVSEALLTATFSLVIGTLFVLDKGTLLPALFSR